MKYLFVVMFVVSLPGLAGVDVASAQQDITRDEQRGLDQITQGRVTSTISFLASDELGGRGTPSPGLTIASAYVASRFRGAGLQPGGDDGSYYQAHSIGLSQTPNSGIQLETSTGEAIPHLGLLNGGANEVTYKGQLATVDLETFSEEEKFAGPVSSLCSDALTGPRAMTSLARRANRLQEQGATALILRTPANHPLLTIAESNRAEPHRVGRRSQLTIPVLLAPLEELPVEIEMQLPAEIEFPSPVKNVIGVLPGSDPELSKEAILFTAHLDHLGTRQQRGDAIYNGADDNASGSTAVLMLADAFAALENRPKRSVIFMTFWGEESGLLGSRYFAENPTWPLEKIVANVNIEMVGRPEPGAHQKCWVTGWEQSDLGPLMAPGAKRVGVEIFEHPSYSSRLYRASDNWALVQVGVIAHSFSAGSLHSDYHQPTDHWEKLDLRHMTEVIKGLFLGSLPIANAEVTPAKGEQSR